MRQLSFGRRMVRLAPIAILCPAIEGCNTKIPSFDVPYIRVSENAEVPPVPTVASIVQRIQCELIDVASTTGTDQDRRKILEQDIQAVVELSLSVTQDGRLAPAFSFLQAPLSFGTGFSREQSREQNFTTYLTYSLAQLSQLEPSKECSEPPDTNLAGTLGLKQMFYLAGFAGPNKKWDEAGKTGVFGGAITFTVDTQLTATGPTWKLTTFEGPGPLLSASNKNVDRLTFGFVRGSKAGRAVAQLRALDVIGSVRQNQITNALQLLANAR